MANTFLNRASNASGNKLTLQIAPRMADWVSAITDLSADPAALAQA